MPLYEYECLAHGRFERLEPMHSVSSGVCPQCGKISSSVISRTHFRMAETFRVVDGKGNITQERQVVSNMPDWRYSLGEDSLGEV